MAVILLSIKPEYVSKILDLTKRYEYRKKIPCNDIERIVIYSSIPEQGVVGEFEVLETISMSPTPLWEKTKREAGISRAKYREYFHGCKDAYAFKIGRVIKYKNVKNLSDLGISQAPQSFVYLNEEQLSECIE